MRITCTRHLKHFIITACMHDFTQMTTQMQSKFLGIVQTTQSRAR